MTRVRIDKSGLGRDIYITGHCANENSGSAEATLVCAAMTTLAQTIAQNVFDSEDTGDTDIIDVTLRSGQAVISYVTDDDGLNTAVDGICKGFDMLEENYPRNDADTGAFGTGAVFVQGRRCVQECGQAQRRRKGKGVAP